jgi:hypothetical protein
MNDERMAQLGMLEVPVAALDGRGEPLQRILDSKGAVAPTDMKESAAPSTGWRVLPSDHGGRNVIFLGAPTGTGTWFLGQLTEHAGDWRFSFHGPLARYPSKAERRAGLQLRWPSSAATVRVGDLFVDVVNISSERWTPTPLDDFYSVGTLAVDGGTQKPDGYFFAYVGGQSPAFVLDPGEYARVRVDIPRDRILEAGLGRYVVYAASPALHLESEVGLPVTIDEVDLEKAAPPPPPPRRRRN